MSNWLDLSNVSNTLRQSYINGFLDASGPIIGRNDVSFNQKLFVEKDASFGDNIYVKNYVYSTTPISSDNSQKLATTAYVQGKFSTISNNGSFSVDVSMDNRLYVQKDTSLNAKLFVNGDASLNKSVFVGGDVSMNSRLFVRSDLSVNGNVNVNGNVTVPTPISSDNSQKVATTAYVKSALTSLTGSSVTFTEDVSINNRLYVGGDASFNGNLQLNNIITTSIITSVTPYSSNATSYSWTNNNITWTASASSEYNASSYSAYAGFNSASTGPSWCTQTRIYRSLTSNSSAQYTGTVSTTILGGVGTISGEWLQIQSSTPVSFNSFSFITCDDGATVRALIPYNFYICGSSDNTSWYPLIYGYWSASPVPNTALSSTNIYSIPTVTNTSSIAGTGSNTANLNYTTYGYQTNTYTYFRLVINEVIGAKFGQSISTYYAEFLWAPYFSKNTPTATNNSLSIYLNSNNVKQLDISGALTVKNNTNLIGDVSLNQRLFVGSDVSMATRLFIGGDLSVNGNVNVNGNVTVPTPISSDNSQKVATTAYVKSALTALTGSSASFLGDVSMNSRLFVGSDASLNSRVFIGGDLSVNGNVNISGIVTVPTPISSDNSQKVATTAYVKSALNSLTGSAASFAGDVSINNQLFVGSDVSMATRVFIGGDLSVNGNVNINGNVTVPTPISTDNSQKVATTAYVKTALSAVTGASASFSGDISINNRLFVGSDVSMSGKLFVVNDVSLNKQLNVGSDVNLGARVIISKDVSMNARLFVGSNVYMNSNLYAYNAIISNGDLSSNSRLFVYYDASLTSRLFVGSDASLDKLLFVGGDASLGGNLAVSGASASFVGDVSINNRLFVGSDASMGGNLAIKNISVNGIVFQF
jgi:predicted acyltransferase (DUF342 family)/uncharacterized membrane protein YeaQ/YmgE (transglycosylase-associated protein family)